MSRIRIVRAMTLAIVALAGCSDEIVAPPGVPAPPSSAEVAQEPEESTPIVEAPASSSTTPPVPSAPACEATSPRPSHVEIVVTPDDGDARILALLAGAKTSVEVTIYQLTSYKVIDALEAAAARGVAVRIILDRKQASQTRIASLEAAGIEVQTSSYAFTYTHQKTVIVDRASPKPTAFVFSGNLDRLSFGSGRNYGVIDQDPNDVAGLVEVFDADWTKRSPNLPCTRLIVAPINARERVLDLIAKTKTTLDIEAMYVTDSDVEDAIVAAHARGVAVRVLLNDPSHDLGDSSEAVARFSPLGILVRRSGALFIHAKLIVSDGSYAFIGSENFSNNSLDHNREAGVVVSTADSDIARITQTFTADWSNGAAF